MQVDSRDFYSVGFRTSKCSLESQWISVVLLIALLYPRHTKYAVGYIVFVRCPFEILSVLLFVRLRVKICVKVLHVLRSYIIQILC